MGGGCAGFPHYPPDGKPYLDISVCRYREGMVDQNDVRMTLPTDRRERGPEMGEQVQILNLEEIREDLASTISAIREKVSTGMLIAVAVTLAGIVVAATLAIARGDHGE